MSQIWGFTFKYLAFHVENAYIIRKVLNNFK